MTLAHCCTISSRLYAIVLKLLAFEGNRIGSLELRTPGHDGHHPPCSQLAALDFDIRKLDIVAQKDSSSPKGFYHREQLSSHEGTRRFLA